MSSLLAPEETFGRQWLESGAFPFMWGGLIPSWCYMVRKWFFSYSKYGSKYCSYPKKGKLKYMYDLHLISLCNIIYKIISKVLVNCLKPMMSKCISHEQYDFFRESVH